MNLTLMKSKIHRATVTDANLNYVGSITISEDLMMAANLHLHEMVNVVNINNGARFETYVIKGEPGKGIICLNGAAARLVQPQDKIIIICYASMTQEEARSWEPTVVFVNDRNQIVKDKRP